MAVAGFRAVLMGEPGYVVAWRQTNMYRVLRPGCSIIIFQTFPQRVSRYANNRVCLGIEVTRPSKGFNGDAVFLDFLGPSGEVFITDKAQHADEIVRTSRFTGG